MLKRSKSLIAKIGHLSALFGVIAYIASTCTASVATCGDVPDRPRNKEIQSTRFIRQLKKIKAAWEKRCHKETKLAPLPTARNLHLSSLLGRLLYRILLFQRPSAHRRATTLSIYRSPIEAPALPHLRSGHWPTQSPRPSISRAQYGLSGSVAFPLSS